MPSAATAGGMPLGSAWTATAGSEPVAGRVDVPTATPGLVFTITDQPGSEQRDRCTVVLADLGDGRTEMRFEQSGGGLTAEGYEAAKRGWGGFFDHMAERLADGS